MNRFHFPDLGIGVGLAGLAGALLAPVFMVFPTSGVVTTVKGFEIIVIGGLGSIPGALKNVIDWVSRFRPQPFNTKHALLLSASPSMVGGNRGLWALRVPLEHLGARVYPDMFSLAQAHQAFDAAGNIANSQLAGRFDQTIVGFMDLAEAAKHYPCAKTAWVEFLGEHPNSPVDRVDAPASS